ncbi:MAG: O-antigen ligase family protein [Halioglobus sp.]|nr:O-antigen ligase family protein [Halioglobus sp.]
MSPSAIKPYHWANTALFYYLLAILAWAPLPLASNRDWSTVLLAGLLLSALAACLLLIRLGHVQATAALRRSRPALYALAATQLWVLTQLLLGITVAPEATGHALLLGVALVAAFTLVLLLVDSRQRILHISQFMVGCAVFQAFFASAMMMSDLTQLPLLDKTFLRSSASGTYVNRNHLAGFLEMNLAIGIGMLVAQLHRYPANGWREFMRRTIDTLLSRKFRLRLYLAIMVVALVLTRSRMGNVAFFSSLLFCGVLGMVLQQRVTRGAVLFFVSLLLIDIYIVGNWFGVDQVVERLQRTTLDTEKRDEVAIDSIAMWQDNFWLGTGADSFFQSYVYGGYMSPDSLYYRHAENDYLEIGSGFGFIGFALLGTAVLTSLWQSFKAQRQRHSRLLQGLGLASAMGITSILIHSFTDFNLHIPANSLWFVVLLAFAWIAVSGVEPPADRDEHR